MEFDPLKFFSETTPADWAPHRSWLEPAAMNPANGCLILPCQSHVVRTSHHTILIDSCIGNHKDRPHRPSWHEKTDAQYLDALAEHSLRPEDIGYVMCTHMHGDHVGWNTRLRDGRWVPTFANARYIFSRMTGGDAAAAQAILDRITENVPLGRVGTPQDIAEAVEFMCGPGAAYMVGSEVTLDGGKAEL